MTRRFFQQFARVSLRVMVCVALGASMSADAGGPLLIGSPTLGVDGQPFVWDTSHPIQYRTDSGTLGSMDNATANTAVAQAFSTWTQVPTASLAVQNVGALLGVAGGHVASVADFDVVTQSCESGAQNPVVYDGNGILFQQLVGDASVVGFESVCNFASSGHIQNAMIVLTGGAGLTNVQQGSVILHEIGHFFGLDHSLTGTNPCGATADDTASRSIMYFQVSTQTGLSADDKAWISTLYPSSTYNSVYGVITGQVFFSDGQNGVQDVLVSAHPISAGSMAGENRAIAISNISGYRFTGNPGQPYTATYLPCVIASGCPHGYYGNNVDGSSFGSRLPSLAGWFEIPVPAGSYALEISDLTSGGSIGPNNPILPLPGPGEYWNAHESANDDDFSGINCNVQRVLDPVVVQAGQPTNGINFIMNRTAAPADVFDSLLNSPTSSTGVHLSMVRGDRIRGGELSK